VVDVAKGSRGEKKIEVIEVLNFRKGSGTGRKGTGENKELKDAKRDAKHRGRRSIKEKLRAQLMKHYGIALEDN